MELIFANHLTAAAHVTFALGIKKEGTLKLLAFKNICTLDSKTRATGECANNRPPLSGRDYSFGSSPMGTLEQNKEEESLSFECIFVREIYRSF
jgi:hypothetical protein